MVNLEEITEQDLITNKETVKRVLNLEIITLKNERKEITKEIAKIKKYLNRIGE